MSTDHLLELSVVVDSEAAEAVSELFNRYNGGFYDDDSEEGEASGGGAVIEATGFDDFQQPLDNEFRLVVKTYIKPGDRGRQIQRQIEEGLGHLSLIYPIPEPQIRPIREEDWAHAWKKFYKPLRVGHRILLKPAWEEIEPELNDIVIELEPGMAFGTGMHPTTRLCLAALEKTVACGDSLLDVGTGSGILSIAAAKLGATTIVATDIDPIAIQVAIENAKLNQIEVGDNDGCTIKLGSVPQNCAARFQIVVANILAEVIVKLFDGEFGEVPLHEPLKPEGHLILSGIIEEKAEMVVEAAKRHGFVVVERLQETDWIALVCQRDAHSSTVYL
ncbi:50S ribosomal protein L11 methyltransferase [Chloroflexi bacterium TSY]|nr:50S ribosomal protein L11 methyltransferase [Chloroflexi bacterium TSY]